MVGYVASPFGRAHLYSSRNQCVFPDKKILTAPGAAKGNDRRMTAENNARWIPSLFDILPQLLLQQMRLVVTQEACVENLYAIT
jgi:hypothetical protein